jgi:hypothetical protein
MIEKYIYKSWNFLIMINLVHLLPTVQPSVPFPLSGSRRAEQLAGESLWLFHCRIPQGAMLGRFYCPAHNQRRHRRWPTRNINGYWVVFVMYRLHYNVIRPTNFHGGKPNPKSRIFVQSVHIMLRDLLTQKCVQKILVTDFGCPRACRFRKHQILNRSPELPLPTF